MTSSPSPLTEEEVELFLSQLKAGDNDKKVDTLQYFVLRLDGVDYVSRDSGAGIVPCRRSCF